MFATGSRRPCRIASRLRSPAGSDSTPWRSAAAATTEAVPWAVTGSTVAAATPRHTSSQRAGRWRRRAQARERHGRQLATPASSLDSVAD